MVFADGLYVVDDLKNISSYASVGSNFAKACEFVAKGDFSGLGKGRNEIDGEKVFVNFDETKYVLKEDRKGELHRKYFDIHIPLEADELIGFAKCPDDDDCPYDEDRDFSNPNGTAFEWLKVKRGEFAICWPKTCVHAPSVTTDVEKIANKLIVKVRA